MTKIGQPDEHGIIHGLFNLREERELAVASFGYIKRDIGDIKNQYICLGFHLYEMQDMKYYEDFGYTDFYEFCEKNFQIDKSAVSRCIDVWWEFGAVDENSCNHKMWLSPEYSDYNYSQLCELLPLDKKQRKKITPDMTVKQIREKKKEWREGREAAMCGPVATSQPEESEKVGNEEIVGTESEEVEAPLSFYGLPKTEYPQDSLITTAGCGHKYTCFSCHVNCSIRQENCYCVEAPLGDPFPCTVLGAYERIAIDVGERCEFVDLELAEHTARSNAPVPCCKHCENPCEYECCKSAEKRDKEKDLVVQQAEDVSHSAEFPILKNMKEREDFVNSYKDWNIWCRNEKTEDIFYRYDLPDGAAIVVRNYPVYIEWTKEEYEGNELFLLVPGYKHFMNCKSNMTEIKNYLKDMKNM